MAEDFLTLPAYIWKGIFSIGNVCQTKCFGQPDKDNNRTAPDKVLQSLYGQTVQYSAGEGPADKRGAHDEDSRWASTM